MIKTGLVLPFLLMPLLGTIAHAETSGKTLFEQGTGEIPACAGCHGVDGWGNGDGAFPALSAQNPKYLAKQLTDFRDGGRHNDVMEPIAHQLTPRQIERLLSYIGSLKVPPSIPAGDIALGKRIAELGKWDAGVPPCESCHGKGGKGIGTRFPALAAQQASYIVASFDAFRNGSRQNDPLGLMRQVANKLSPEETAAVAQYFQSQGRRK